MREGGSASEVVVGASRRGEGSSAPEAEVERMEKSAAADGMRDEGAGVDSPREGWSSVLEWPVKFGAIGLLVLLHLSLSLCSFPSTRLILRSRLPTPPGTLFPL